VGAFLGTGELKLVLIGSKDGSFVIIVGSKVGAALGAGGVRQ